MIENRTIDFAQAITEDMKLYAEEVNFNRSIVDISGLKRVQLRILYTMYKMKLFPDKPYGKCLDIVGNVIKIHPHGDKAVYDALVRMGQPWVLNYPLIDYDGNFGTEDGDPPAAARYTSARLSKFGLKLIKDVESTSPFVDDYLEHSQEPAFLMPSSPALFVNNSKGMGVAAACNFLPHKMEDIVRVIGLRMQGKSAQECLEDLVPSFPTGGVICNGNDLPRIYENGAGTIILRGDYRIQKNKIIYTEFPFQVGRTKIIKAIEALKDERIINVSDDTEMDNQSISIEVTNEADIISIIDRLHAETPLQSRFFANMTVHDRITVNRYPFIKLIDSYIDLQHKGVAAVAKRENEEIGIILNKLQGFLIVLSKGLDRAIEIIKTSDTKAAAQETLKKEFGLNGVQADYILSLRLSQLTKRGTQDIAEEIESLEAEVAKNQELIDSKKKREEHILKELSQFEAWSGPKTRVSYGYSLVEDAEAKPLHIRGQEILLSDKQELVVVTKDKKAYRFNAKNLNKFPNTEDIIFVDTTDNLKKLKSVKILNSVIPADVLLFMAKSARGKKITV